MHISNHGLEALSFLSSSASSLNPNNKNTTLIPLSVILIDLEMLIID